MGFITIFLLALGLCFDSFAVSFSSGMSMFERRWVQSVRFAAVLAIFQGVMPVIGWVVAVRLLGFISHIDHWVAFILLSFIGAKMIKESFERTPQSKSNPFKFTKSCVLGFATSIDALVAGIALAMVNIKIAPGASQTANMALAALIITVVTFVASAIGLTLGKKATKHLGEKAEFLGGVILIVIGLKVLVEHLFFT